MKDKRVGIFGGMIILIISIISVWVWNRSDSETEIAESESIESVESIEQPKVESARERLESKLQMIPKQVTEEERLANWKANFPYKKTYHPTLKFDPALYDPKDSSTWHGPHRKRIFPVIQMHGALAKFFENENRFCKGFEDLYNLLKEYDRHDNPRVVASMFENLADYYNESAYPPDEVITEERDTGEFNPFTGAPITEKVPAHFGRRSEPLKTMTYGEYANSFYEGIGYKLHAPRMWPDKEYMPEEEMLALRDRIMAEIDPNDIPKSPGFAYSGAHEEALEAGDPFLIPKEGWVEAHWQWQKDAAPIIARRLQERMMQENSNSNPNP